MKCQQRRTMMKYKVKKSRHCVRCHPHQNPSHSSTKFFEMVRYVMHSPLLWQVRAQTRTDSTRSYDSHSSSTISSDAAGGNRPPPPPVALKPSLNRLNQSSEEQSPGKEEPDPANKSFLGKVSVIISLFGAVIDEQSSSCSGLLNLTFPLQ